jgi:hypothetical protein
MKKDTTASIGKFHKCWIVALLFMCLYFREVFNKIAAEEIDLFKAEESDDFEIPGFGTSTSSYDDVIKLTMLPALTINSNYYRHSGCSYFLWILAKFLDKEIVCLDG